MKYFYDDALEAAYMCKHHGMKFHTADDDKWFGKGGDTPEGILVWLNVTGGRRLYLNEECHELLKRRVGDLVTNIGLTAKTVINIDGTRLYHGDETYTLEGCEIIQRNGKAFFMPEISIDSHLPTVHIDEFLK